MKKFLTLITVLISIFIGMQNTFAQSINVGYVNSSYVVKDGGSSFSMNGNGIYAGFDYDYSLDNSLYLNPGVYFDFIDYNVYGNLHGTAFYVRVPIHLKYMYTLDNALTVFATAGPSLTYALGGKIKYHEGGIAYSENFFDEYDQRFDIPLGLEVGLNINRLYKVVVGYDFGLLNQAKDDDYKLVKNMFHVGLGYNF